MNVDIKDEMRIFQYVYPESKRQAAKQWKKNNPFYTANILKKENHMKLSMGFTFWSPHGSDI